MSIVSWTSLVQTNHIIQVSNHLLAFAECQVHQAQTLLVAMESLQRELAQLQNDFEVFRAGAMELIIQDKDVAFESFVRQGNVDMVKCMLDHNMNPDSQCASGSLLSLALRLAISRPLRDAQTHDLLRIARAFVLAGAKSWELFREAVCAGDLPMIKAAISVGCEVNQISPTRTDARMSMLGHVINWIHKAAPAHPLDIVREIVQAKANVDASERGGRAPMGMACRVGELEICKYLVQQGADLTSSSCLGHAVWGGHFEVARWLLSPGGGNAPEECCNASMENPDHLNPLVCALTIQHWSCAELLFGEALRVAVPTPFKPVTALWPASFDVSRFLPFIQSGTDAVCSALEVTVRLPELILLTTSYIWCVKDLRSGLLEHLRPRPPGRPQRQEPQRQERRGITDDSPPREVVAVEATNRPVEDSPQLDSPRTLGHNSNYSNNYLPMLDPERRPRGDCRIS